MDNSQESVFSSQAIKTETPNGIDIPVTSGVQSQKTPKPKKAEQTPKKPEFIYFLYFADDETEYYTKITPLIEGSRIYLKNVIKKGTLTEKVMGKELSVEYNATDGVQEAYERELFGSHGFALKLLDYDTTNLTWIQKTTQEAVNELKDKKLSIYDQVVPEMYNRMNQMERKQDQVDYIEEDEEYYPQHKNNNGRLLNW